MVRAVDTIGRRERPRPIRFDDPDLPAHVRERLAGPVLQPFGEAPNGGWHGLDADLRRGRGAPQRRAHVGLPGREQPGVEQRVEVLVRDAFREADELSGRDVAARLVARPLTKDPEEVAISNLEAQGDGSPRPAEPGEKDLDPAARATPESDPRQKTRTMNNASLRTMRGLPSNGLGARARPGESRPAVVSESTEGALCRVPRSGAAAYRGPSRQRALQPTDRSGRGG